MGMKLVSLAALLALGGAAVTAAADTFESGAESASGLAPETCGIDVDSTADGLLLTAWSLPETEAENWRMVVTQRTGGGGFDIVQEGDIYSDGEPVVIVSDILMNPGTDFSARLTTRAAGGAVICDFGGQA